MAIAYGDAIGYEVAEILASVTVTRATSLCCVLAPKSISAIPLVTHHPPPPDIFIVAVAPAPLAVTPAPVKLRVVTVVEVVLHSSCTVIVPPPPPVLAIVSWRVAPVPDGVIVIFVPATSSASVCARLAELKSDTAVLGIEIATLDIAVTSPFALTVGEATCVALPKVPTFEFTVARVRAVAPVASPVWVAFDTSPEYRVFTALSPVFVPDRLATAPFASIAFDIAPLAMAVAFPVDVTGQVRFAFVTTVVAKLPVPDPVTPPVSVIV